MVLGRAGGDGYVDAVFSEDWESSWEGNSVRWERDWVCVRRDWEAGKRFVEERRWGWECG